MSEYDEESDIVRALRAPGSPDELSGEQEILAAFRSANTVEPKSGGLVRRLGIGGTTAVVVIALSGGVAAAAWTNLLPDRLQHAAHDALGGLGVPAPGPNPDPIRAGGPADAPTDAPTTAPTDTNPAPTDSASTPQPSPSPSANQPSQSPTNQAPAGPAADPAPSQSPSDAGTSEPSPSTAPSSSPTTDPTRDTRPPKVRSIVASASAKRVAEGASITVTGVATDASGSPVSDRPVALVAKTRGGWRVVAHARSGPDGSVSLSTGPVAASSTFRLAAAGAHSGPVRVAVAPTMTATYADGQVTVSTSASWAGEQVVFRVGDRVVATATLDATGSAVVSAGQRRVAFRVVAILKPTSNHAAARATVVVPKSG